MYSLQDAAAVTKLRIAKSELHVFIYAVERNVPSVSCPEKFKPLPKQMPRIRMPSMRTLEISLVDLVRMLGQARISDHSRASQLYCHANPSSSRSNSRSLVYLKLL